MLPTHGRSSSETRSMNRHDIRSDLATPFQATSAVRPIYYNSPTNSSVEALEDAERRFRPFPEHHTHRNRIQSLPTYVPVFRTPDFQSQGDVGDSHSDEVTITESNTSTAKFYAPDYEDSRSSIETEHQVVTTNGNLILDSETSSYILHVYGISGQIPNEFRYMRYSSVTCEPDRFFPERYALRQNYFEKPRNTEIMVCITLYDEEPHLVARTLRGVIKNILHLTRKKNEPVWGPESYKKILVCFIADGRNKINNKTLSFFAAMGLYQDGFAKAKVGDRDVKAHLYEHTTHLMPKHTDLNDITFERCEVPIQMLLCLKEKNKKKINSHRWCFQAFSEVLKPSVVVLLDAGTQPTRDSIYHMWKAFDYDPQVGGCCGEIKAALGDAYRNLLNPLVAAQNFEYKISNILDKPTESVFGFVSVLPGAFSAYRYTALLGKPLQEYFKGEALDDSLDAGVFEKNMYLAEDRILCFELVTKRNNAWLLKYVKSAVAETDTPISIASLIKQRRRWLNGSFFVSFYSVIHFYRLWQSGHSIWRKIFLQIEFVYQTVQLIVSWFSVASFFLVFRILTVSLEDYFGAAKYLAGIFLWMYVVCIVTTFVLSFGNRPEGAAKFYSVMLIFFAVLVIYTIFAAIFMSVKAVQEFVKAKDLQTLILHNSRFRDLTISTVSTYVLYFVASFLCFEPWHMFTSFIQYLLVSPTYINVFNIYAFCNLHDLSWGNRDDKAEPESGFEVEKLSPDQKQDGEMYGNEYIVKIDDVPMDQDDVDDQYQRHLQNLVEPISDTHRLNRFGIRVKVNKTDPETRNKDYYALIRSLVVLSWMGTNFGLIAVVLSRDGFTRISNVERVYQRRSEVFLTVILWIVAFLAAFRFLGCVFYLVTRSVESRLTSKPSCINSRYSV